jgi:carbamoyl-phosphate synthase large subunit
MMVEEIAAISAIDPWFLCKIEKLVNIEEELAGSVEAVWDIAAGQQSDRDISGLLRRAKEMRLPDRFIGDLIGLSEASVRRLCKRLGLSPTYKMVDTCAAEFEAETPYFYSCVEDEDEAAALVSQRANPAGLAEGKKGRIVVIGSGPIRIGQGIEFDYCSVHCVWALREAGYEAIIINNNPETVSTDFDTGDKLYFEPLTPEDVMNIIETEKADGVIVQFGGQTAINLAEPLTKAGVKIFGSSFESIELAEDRDKFEKLLSELDIPKPAGRAVTNAEDAIQVAEEIGYPVLVRPSFVLGGRAMEIVHSKLELSAYMTYAVDVSPKAPILVDKYIVGKEVEVDVISDGVDCLMPGIMEHIERAGVHSGDSMAVCPPQSLSESVIEQVTRHAVDLARALEVKGLMNIQFVVENDVVQVIEVNPRASRTVPYLSKITGVPMIKVATNVILGQTLAEQGFGSGLYRQQPNIAVKAPVFSFSKLTQVDISLGPEMKSTGEVMGVDTQYGRALYKAMLASGIDVPLKGSMLVTVADIDKPEALPIIREFAELGFRVYATGGTSAFLREHGIKNTAVHKISEGSPNMLDLIRGNKVDLLVNTISKDKHVEMEGAIIRRATVQHGIPCLTSLDTARALLLALEARRNGEPLQCLTIDQYLQPVVLTGVQESEESSESKA